MQSIAIAHCMDNFYREYAYKTVPGLDKPNEDGILSDTTRPRTHPLKSGDRLENIIKKYSNRPGQYITVYAFSELVKEGDRMKSGDLYKDYLIGKAVNYDSAKINRLYLDFDSEENPQEALSEAIIVMRELIKHNIYVHCYFSGKKGIALYIEFQTLDIQPENKRAVIAALHDLIIETISESYENWFGMAIPAINSPFGYNLNTLDVSVRGDIARVSRIPNSKHKSGLYCIPLTPGDMYKGIDYIRKLAKTPRLDIDLDNVITTNIRRNSVMNNIVKNIEKQVIADRNHNKTIIKFKKEIQEQRKKKYKNKPGMITEEELQKAKAVSISDIIGTTSNRTQCPVHGGDNTTSLQIDHSKGLWYCYSCQKGGDGITFVMLKNGIDFKTAVKQLAEA